MRIKRDILGEGIILSTVKPPFWAWFGEYETGITFNNQEKWIILKGYDTREDAIQGHEEFKNMSIDELKALEDISCIF